MKKGRMQAKDIGDRTFLRIIDYIAATPWPNGADNTGSRWVMFWEVAGALPLTLAVADIERLVLAKAQSLIKRELLDGCVCGCRGDFEITCAGQKFLDIS